MPSPVEQQRAVAVLILSVISGDDFALAGSGALREHGLIDRPTHDVDVFTLDAATERFQGAVERTIATLIQHGYQVVPVRRLAQFARLAVTAGDDYQFEVDFGVDWRAHDPVWLEVGPVLALTDAVANKVGALYSRAAARDFLDVDAIRQSGRFTDKELLHLAAEHDPGFDLLMFANQLGLVATLRPSLVAEYGVSADALAAIQQRLQTWRQQVLESRTGEPTDIAGRWEVVEEPRHNPHQEPPRHSSGPSSGVPI
jgi:hypothetical protein